MIRYTLLTLAVVFLAFYSFRDWYKSLCGVIIMMAFIERPDMPRQMLGITGMNPWTILMAFTMLGCFINAKRENLRWDMPPWINFLLVSYIAILFLAFFRMPSDTSAITAFYEYVGRRAPTARSMLVDDLLNSVKYVVPAALIFYGCNSKNRLLYGISACLIATFILGLQIIKWMPISQLGDASALSDRALRVLDREIGYHRVDLAAMMASASWAFYVVRSIPEKIAWKWGLTFAGTLLILALALTGGRTGYGTWLVLAAIFAALKWRRLIVVMPIVVLIAITLVPAARDRMFEGFAQESEFSAASSDEATDLAAVTSDRILIWPTVIDKIADEPLLGYGRHGFFTSGASREIIELWGRKGGTFPHPHNAYLEFLIDNGILGALPVFAFFGFLVFTAIRLFRHSNSTLVMATSGLALSFVLGQLLASIGAQSFYPRAGVVIMWCMIGLYLRVYVEAQSLATTSTQESDRPRALHATTNATSH